MIDVFREFKNDSRGVILKSICLTIYRMVYFSTRETLLHQDKLFSNLSKIVAELELKKSAYPEHIRILVNEISMSFNSKVSQLIPLN